MSYILEALKKSEKKRPPGTVPDLFTVQGPLPAESPRRPWVAFAAAAMAIAALAVGGWAWLGRGDRQVAPSEERSTAPVAAPPAATGDSRGPVAGSVPIAQVPASAPVPARSKPAAPAPTTRRPAAGKVPAPVPAAVQADGVRAVPAPSAAEAPAHPAAPATQPAVAPPVVKGQTTVAPEPALLVAAPPSIPAAGEIPAPAAPVPAMPVGEAPRVAVPSTLSPPPATAIPAPTAVAESPSASQPQEAPPADAPPEDGRVVDLEALPQDLRASVGKLSVSGHVWSEEPGLRMLTVSDRIVREGQEAAPGVRLEEITQDGAVFTTRGWRFRMAGR